MKAVILVGGYGTRISEESEHTPKPMIQIGGIPIVVHIMRHYAKHGVNEFVLCLGYKGHVIKEYFSNYFMYNSDVTFDFSDNSMELHQSHAEPWKVTLVDTGLDTLTGGRLKRVASYLQGEKAFCMTYGDGVSDIDITAEIAFHKAHGGLATVASVVPPGRFGALQLDGHQVTSFQEKPAGDGARINGGFFVLSPDVIPFIEGDATSWEEEPLRKLAAGGHLHAYAHEGFWQPMDTLRDKRLLEKLWDEGSAPWV